MSLPSTAPALLGRERELALIDAVLVGARSSVGSTAMFSGEPGSGKTSLLERARELADGFQVVSCRGVEWEAELPFSSLHDLLRPLLGELDALPTPQRRAVEGALGLGDDDDVQRLNVYAGTLSLLVEATRARPVLVLIDDLQWIDSETKQALSFIARRVVGEEIGMLVGARPEAQLEGLPAAPLVLGPLDDSAIAELANRQLEAPLPEAAVRGLAAATGGNPLAVVESVRQFGEGLRDRGALLDDPLPVTQLIERAFADRLASLSPAAREAIELIAASLNGAATELAAAAGVLPVAPDAFSELEAAGVATQRGGRFEISHPVLRSVVHAQTNPRQLRRCYAALASAAVGDPAHRAWYAAAAADAPDEPIAAALDAAAARFITQGGYLAAAQALRRSAELTPDLDRRAERLLRAGRQAHLGGRSPWAQELLQEAQVAAVELRTSMRVELERTTVAMHVVEGYPSAASQLSLADKAWEVDHNLSIVALAAASAEAVVSGRGDLLREIIARMDQRGSDPELVPDSVQAMNSSLAMALLLTSAPGRDAEAVELLRGTARFRLETSDLLAVEADNDAFVADALLWIEDYDLCEQLCADAVRRSRASGDVFTLQGLAATDGNRKFRTGDWDGAAAAYAETLRLTSIVEIGWMQGLFRVMEATLLAARGDDTILSIAGEVEELGTGFGFAIIVQYTASALGLYHLGLGDYVGAAEALDRADAWTRAAGQVDAGMTSWPTDHVEAHLLAGNTERARALLEDVRATNLEAGARPWKAAAIARLDGLIASDDDFEPHFRRALELYEVTRTPFDRARTQLAFGQRLRRARRRVEAREQLGAALVEFDRLGAQPWADRARREMGASAASLNRGRNFDPDALTPQEQQVAELVATGASNKEVAGTMFLSPKTIEAHLSRIYRKLGVSSRTQLAARLRG